MSQPGKSAPALVLALCGRVEEATRGGPLEVRAAEARARLEGPLRVAIAGRVKAGKSTMLNALVGEQLAPTDAGECTRIISWYERGPGYDVAAQLRSGEDRPLPFQRVGGALDIDLGELEPADVAAIRVRWPSSMLDDLTLVDTPGLASAHDENSIRTRDFLTHDDGTPHDVDAVIYLMRHVHRADAEFLEAFMDRSVPSASSVNAIAILSRADEIGGGRLDALESVARIAERYRGEPKLQSLCSTVVPLAGLLAETGLTLREDEAASLKTLASTERDELDRMLLSADEFCDVGASDLTVERRRGLLDRLGMYGLRLAVAEIQDGRVSTASDLSRLFVARSGIAELRRLLREHLVRRARPLQARAALELVRSIARDLEETDPETATSIQRDAERIESSAIDLAQLRVAQLVLSGAVDVEPDERSEIERVAFESTPAAVVGLPETADPTEARAAAEASIGRWRSRAADPLAGPLLVEVCETMARAYEEVFVEINTDGQHDGSDGGSHGI